MLKRSIGGKVFRLLDKRFMQPQMPTLEEYELAMLLVPWHQPHHRLRFDEDEYREGDGDWFDFVGDYLESYPDEDLESIYDGDMEDGLQDGETSGDSDTS